MRTLFAETCRLIAGCACSNSCPAAILSQAHRHLQAYAAGGRQASAAAATTAQGIGWRLEGS